MNNPTIKLDLDSIINVDLVKMHKIDLFFILVCCVQSYLLPFSCRLRLHFLLPFIKITARIYRQTANPKKLTKAGDRNPPITAHGLTSVWLSRFLKGQVCCTDYWKQNGAHVTVCLGLNFRTRSEVDLKKVSSFSKNSNQINIRLWNRG